MNCVLDASAFTAAMRREPAMMEFLMSRLPGDVATAPSVVAEIEYGIRRIGRDSRKRFLLERERDRLLSVLKVLSWTPEVSGLFGSFKADLERRGQTVDDLDVAVAAIAAAHEAEVVTANPDPFHRIAGVSSRHWIPGAAVGPH
jgi:tRNA(fMet)-specific endonuclease VapC